MAGLFARLSLALLLVALALPARAGETPFGYVYTTDTHPQGQFEFEHWSTLRTGKPHGDYDLWEHREEIEYGVTSDFQLSGYFNWYSVNAFRDQADRTTGGPFVPENIDTNTRYSVTKFDSVSVEGIYRLLSPYKDPLGLALYLEPSYGPERRELEHKVLLQKNFLEDRLVLASNITYALEWEHKTGDASKPAGDPESVSRWEKESEIEFTAGASYMFLPHWYGGLEFRNHNVFSGFSLGNQEFAAFFAGPSVHYTTDGWWATLTVLPQLPIGRAYNDEAKQNFVHGRIYNDHEEMEVRLRAGVTF